MRRKSFLVAGILLVLMSGPSHAQRNEGAAGAEPTRNPRLLGRWYYGPVYSSAAHGDRLYFGSGGAIRVLRIEDGALRELASTFTPGVVRQLVASGDRLYMADESGALRIFDLSNPDRPVEIGRAEQPRGIRSLVVQGKYAYTANGWSGLGVVDVSNPESPRPIGTTKAGGYATDVHVRDSFAYLAANQGGLRIFDVSKPEAPREVGHLDKLGTTFGITTSGKYAYAVSLEENNGDGRLWIIDVSDPTTPRLKGFHQLDYGAERVVVKDGLAYLDSLARAMESYLKALQIREALVAASPRDVQSRRDLARS